MSSSDDVGKPGGPNVIVCESEDWKKTGSICELFEAFIPEKQFISREGLGENNPIK
jgi:hypothetical protein